MRVRGYKGMRRHDRGMRKYEGMRGDDYEEFYIISRAARQEIP